MNSRRRKSATTYKRELRSNRKLHFKSHFQSLLRQAGVDPSIMEASVLRGLKNLQNRTRGRVFEVMGEVMTSSTLGDRIELTDWSPDKQKRFETPFGQRRADLYYPTAKLMVEIKSGYITCNRDIRTQIVKDRWIKDNDPDVNDVAWILFRGASRSTIALLDDSCIEWFDIEYDRPLDEE